MELPIEVDNKVPTASGVVWFLFSVSILVIFSLVAAWASSQSTRLNQLEERANIVEQHFAALQVEIGDLRGHIDELGKKIDGQGR